MSTPWNLESLRSQIRGLGPDYHELLDVVNSIGRSVDIFRYHLFTARDALKGFVDETNPTGPETLKLILGVTERRSEFALAKLVSEANIIGCIHTVRSLADIFGQLVNGLVLQEPIPVHECDIVRVQRKLPESDLKSGLEELVSSYWFKYLSAFVNTTKHRQLVQHRFTVDFDENRSDVRFSAFDYNAREYPVYWGTQVLEGIVEVKNSIVACGRTLNRCCATGT